MSRRALQRFQQFAVVALVQADGWLVQHIEHAGQAGADLRGEANALAFTARERPGGACQGQIVETDIVEEFQAGANFLQDAGGDFLLLGRQLLVYVAEPGVGMAMDISQTWPIWMAPILTDSVSGLRR